jgi:hypothetical protein
MLTEEDLNDIQTRVNQLFFEAGQLWAKTDQNQRDIEILEDRLSRSSLGETNKESVYTQKNMNINNVYTSTSNYLKAADLQGRRVDLTIEAAEIETIQDVEKIVLSFKGKEKRFILNITNARMIAELLNATDTEQWIGKEITLRPDKTTYQGDLVDCLRVDSVLPGKHDETDVPF